MIEDEEIHTLPAGYHERVTFLVNQIIHQSRDALAIAEEFSTEEENSVLELEDGDISIVIKRISE